MFFGYHCETTIIKNREQKQQKAEMKKVTREKEKQTSRHYETLFTVRSLLRTQYAK